MARFEVFSNPNRQASHALLLDVQSDLVLTSTRWCVPMFAARAGTPLLTHAQVLVRLSDQEWVLDTPNILAVPGQWLKKAVASVAREDRASIESALDFMMRGY